MEASEIRLRARVTLQGQWLPSVLTALIASIFGALITSGNSNFEINLDTELLEGLPSFVRVIFIALASVVVIIAIGRMIVGGPVQLGYAQYLLKQQDGVESGVQDLFSQFHRIGQGFLQYFLRSLFTMLWSLLFIIPGIVKSFSYAMTPFIMAENPQMTAREAIEASKQMMDGHKGELFWLNLTFFGWSILCVFTLGIGFLFLIPYMNASYAVFYRSISRPAATKYAEM